MKKGKTYIIVLNYNGFRDTIPCLESLLKLRDSDFSVVIVDNQSTDGSFEKIRAFLDGRETELSIENFQLRHLAQPVSAKPFPYVVLDEAEAYGPLDTSQKVFMIRALENMGYGPGNNIGIRFAMQDPDCAYIWILNNDTLTEPYCLAAMIRQFESDREKGIKTGGVGPKICYMHEPGTIQSTGSIFKPWLCFSKLEDQNMPRHTAGLLPKNHVHHLVGASVLFEKKIFEETGLFCDDHFVYLEEIDFSIRAGKKGWTFSFQPEAVIYHKENATISKSDRHPAGNMTDFYWSRNKILVTLRYYPWFIFPVLLSSLLSALLKSIRSRRVSRFFFYLDAIVSGFSYFFGFSKDIKIYHHKYLKK